MDFVAVDVETANSHLASICQIGLASFKDGALTGEWKSYIDPQDWFNPLNVAIHGIDERTVAGAPRLPEVAPELLSWLHARVAVCHTHFDRVAVQRAFDKHGLGCPSCTWLDSARVARRAWSEFESQGYGLYNVCKHIGHEFTHHDALEDAKAAAQVLLAAIKKTGLSVEDWLLRVEQPIHRSSTGKCKKLAARKGNPEGPFFGEVMVFTGTLRIWREKAADLAASVGCEVAPGVTKRTTVLVVGDQDASRLAGHDKSLKHRKAEKLIREGQQIRILGESDFIALLALASPDLGLNQIAEQVSG